jgi:hypothetical protein
MPEAILVMQYAVKVEIEQQTVSAGVGTHPHNMSRRRL